MNRLRATTALAGATLIAAAAISSPASAGLMLFKGYQDAALSIGGYAGNTNATGSIQADVAAGSTVLEAYLYSADVWGSGNANVNLAGNVLTTGTGTLLDNANPANVLRWDVTSIVKPVIDAGPGGIYNFDLTELGTLDGEVLVVAYKNASTTGGTAIILDGELATNGDSTNLVFASPYTGGDAIMSLASSFSYNGDANGSGTTGQVTTVDVTTNSTSGRRLTSCLGGNDDGGFVAANGLLMTVGGIGDSTANPDPSCSSGAADDELYNLAFGNSADATAFLQNGDTFLRLDTANPSNDDNVFFLGLTSSFQITSVDDTPITPGPTSVPEPGTLGLMGLGLAGILYWRRRRS